MPTIEIPRKAITQSELKEELTYDPTSGLFTSNRAIRGRRKGAVCGCVDKDGYIQIRVRYTLYRAHRLAFLYMTGQFPSVDVDHINQTRSDNSWGNLRNADATINSRNSKLYKTNKSGIPGVRFMNERGKWKAEICVNYRNVHLGYFKTITDAADARKSAEALNEFHPNHGMINA